MQEKHLYEYSIVRIVPRIEREEFLNVGVVLFSKSASFLQLLYKFDEGRIRAFSKELDLEQLQLNLRSFDKICQGEKEGGPIAGFDLPSRFRWLTAERSSVIQTSRPHPGLCANLEETLARLFKELVL